MPFATTTSMDVTNLSEKTSTPTTYKSTSSSSEEVPYDKWNWLSSSFSSTSTSTSTIARYEQSVRHLPTAPKNWRRIHHHNSSSFEEKPKGRCSHSVTEVNDHALLLFGGGYSSTSSRAVASTIDNTMEEEDLSSNDSFVHLDDMWSLDALTAKWTRIEYVLSTPPGTNRRNHHNLEEEEETNDSYWGMNFGPPRRGHAAAYYNPQDDSATTPEKGYLIVFGGITEGPSSSSSSSNTTGNSSPLYLGDTWIFNLSTHQWRRLSHPLPSSENNSTTTTTTSNKNYNKPPSPRRGAISWIDNHHFYIFGGEDARGTSAAFADAIHGVDLVFDDAIGGLGADNEDLTEQEAVALRDVLFHEFMHGDVEETTTMGDHHRIHPPRRREEQQQNNRNQNPQNNASPQHCPILFQLGPLNLPPSQWKWTIQKSYNSSFLHKRAPNWPTVATSPKPFGSVAFAAHALVGRRLWIFGGLEWHLGGPESQLFYRLDLDTFEWVVLHAPKNAPCPRYNHGMTSIGRYLLIGGGVGLLRPHDVVVDVANDGSAAPVVQMENLEEGALFDLGNQIDLLAHLGGGNGAEREEEDSISDASQGSSSTGSGRRHQEEGNDNNNLDDTNNRAINQNNNPTFAAAFAQNNHWTPTFAIQERTIFDLHLFDTETMKWSTLKKTDVIGPWPSARNAFSLSRLGRDKAIVFGGGVYPCHYYDDTYVLEFDLPNKVPKPTGSMEDSICSDMNQLLQTGLMSDMTLIAGGGDGTREKEFPVHKVILALRCNFFNIMFSGPYAESSASEIHLPDVEPDALDVVLKYIYTGAIDCTSIIGSEDEDAMFFRGCCEGDDDIHKSLAFASSILGLCDMWELTKLFETIEDLLATSAKRWDASPSSCYADTIGLIVFAKAHNCKRLVMQGLEFARRRWDDKMKYSDVVKNADPEIIAEIEDFVNSLL